MFRLLWVINIVVIFHISSSSSEGYSSTERLLKTNTISTAETIFDLRVIKIKTLMCCIISYIDKSQSSNIGPSRALVYKVRMIIHYITNLHL